MRTVWNRKKQLVTPPHRASAHLRLSCKFCWLLPSPHHQNHQQYQPSELGLESWTT